MSEKKLTRWQKVVAWLATKQAKTIFIILGDFLVKASDNKLDDALWVPAKKRLEE